MTWSEMSTRQRVACVVLFVPALVVYGLGWVVVRLSEKVGLE